MLVNGENVLLSKDNGRSGTLKHRLVSYVMDYSKIYFLGYVLDIMEEMRKRNIKLNRKYYKEISDFCEGFTTANYPEHNDRYLKQCQYNLQEKFDRGIISKEEWEKIISINNTIDNCIKWVKTKTGWKKCIE